MNSSVFMGEFLGTVVLILLGNGVVANVLLEKAKGQNAGWMVITAGWAFAVTFGIFVAQKFGSADAHLNPAVSLAMAIHSGDYASLANYWPAQLLGAMLGAALVWLHHKDHWAITPDTNTKFAAFGTSPAIKNTTNNLISEVIGTAMLIVGVMCIYATDGDGLKPFLVGVLVWAIGLSLGGPTGYAINPARDLGPRIMHALLPIAGKGKTDWSYAWIPVVGPLVGAALAVLLF